jgi:hypothetical protein
MEWKSITGFPAAEIRGAVQKMALMVNRNGFGLRLDGLLGRHNAPVNPKRKKAIAAGRAAIGRRAEQSVNPGKHAHAVLA